MAAMESEGIKKIILKCEKYIDIIGVITTDLREKYPSEDSLYSYAFKLKAIIEVVHSAYRNYQETLKLEDVSSRRNSSRIDTPPTYSLSRGSFSKDLLNRGQRGSLGSLSEFDPKPKNKGLMSLFSVLLKGNSKRTPSISSLAASANSDKEDREKDADNQRSRAKVTINDFEIIKPISRGAFGKVYLSKKCSSNDLYAIKILKKDDMIRKNMVAHVLAERKVLSISNNPFVVKMYYAFQSKSNLYIVMEYMIGGDLSSILGALGTFDQNMVRIYTAEVVMALEYLHNMNIIHRDIKPDNMLLNREGHIKLSDFGLSRISVPEQENVLNENPDKMLHRLNTITKSYVARQHSRKLNISCESNNSESEPGINSETVELKRNQSRRINHDSSSKGILGTPDYLAPELLMGLNHGAAVDWWALGICMFEWLVGYPPFMDESPELIFSNILNHEIDWPQDLLVDAKNVIIGLLDPDTKRRLKAEGIKVHQFFVNLDWATIRDQPAPFKPAPVSVLDTSYFDGMHF